MHRDPSMGLVTDAPVEAPLESGSREVSWQRVERTLAIDDQVRLGTHPLSNASAGDNSDVEMPTLAGRHVKIAIQPAEVLVDATQIGADANQEGPDGHLDTRGRQASQRRR